MDYGAPGVRVIGAIDAVAIKAAGARIVEGPAELTLLRFGADSIEADLVVCAPHELDEAYALHWRAALLCDPTAPELAAEVALALHGGGHRLADPARDADMRRLAEEAARLARALTELVDREGPAAVRDRASDYRGEPASDPPLAIVRRHVRARRLRARFFDAALFADPAWDMLLDLYAARLADEPVAVSSLCIAAQVPPTTALRWIRALTEQGLFVRQPDTQDKRRVHIALSVGSARALASWFAASGGD